MDIGKDMEDKKDYWQEDTLMPLELQAYVFDVRQVHILTVCS